MMKGLYLKEFFTLRTYVAKMIGLTAILVSGLSVGKEGNLVHLSSIIS